MTPPSTPIRIFIAYSKHDEAYLKALLKHLKPSTKNNTIEVFHDGEIEAGKEWNKTIKDNLHQSDIILLLVSANFVATDYCYDEEMIAAIALHEQGKAQVIPIIVTPFDFEDMPFAKLNFLPSKAKPISLYKDEGQHQAYTEIVIALKINYKEVYKRREVLQKAKQEQEAQEKAEQERQEKEEKAAKRKQYDDCCKNADNLFKQERWGQAKEQYKAAQGMYEAGYTPKADALQIKIERCDDEIAARDYIDHAKTCLQDRKYEKAALSLQNALKEKPSLKERPDIQTLQQQIQDGIVAERERKAHEEAERKAREEAERKAHEEAERKAHEEAKIRQLPVPIQQLLQDMVLVEGGSFMMGSDDGRDSEKPVHRVSLDSFHIAKYPMTQAQWQVIMGSNPSGFKGDNLPVEQVSWQDVQDCVAKLNAMLQKAELPAGFCLPTEAQWEYAARGGNKSKDYKYAGSDDIDKVAWYDGNSSNQTQPVGQKEANELGLYDMTGNVWEWCADWYGGDYYKNSSTNNPIGPSTGTGRALRGGSWGSSAGSCRVVIRGSGAPTIRYNILGFRLVVR